MDIDRYAYLLLGLFFFSLWLICFLMRKDLRPILWRLSCAGAICGPLSELWYFRDYWLPPTIVGQGVLSPEDVLFGFSVFGVAAVSLPVILRKKFVSNAAPSPSILLFFILSFFVGFFLFTDLLGINSILTASLVMFLWWVVIALLRRDLLLSSFGNGLLLAAFSIIIYSVLLDVATEYLERYWLLSGQPLGRTIFGGTPLTEIVWYFLLGTSTFSVAAYAEGKKVA